MSVSSSGGDRDLTDLALAALFAVMGFAGILWVSAWMGAWVVGGDPPEPGLARSLDALASPGDPSAAWGTRLPGPLGYWATVLLITAIGVAALGLGRWLWRDSERLRSANPRTLAGTATAREVSAAASPGHVRRRAVHARPSLSRPRPQDVGYLLGRSRARQVWASVEDSMLVVGPPRSGKGLHVVIPMILDAPGAVVSTSTRPDNLAVTMQARSAVGPVAVFDPQHLAAGVSRGLRWSPVRGCELPQTAMIRARGLPAPA
jgi:type IV secretion system protein VirD4